MTTSMDSLAQSGEAFCSTVLCAEVDPDERTVELASAGHLSPVLFHSLDGASLLDFEVGPPLGVTSHRPPAHRLMLSEDDCLVLYTDGVIERRHRGIDESFRMLTEIVAHQDCEPIDIAAALRTLATETGAEDDATAVVIRLLKA